MTHTIDTTTYIELYAQARTLEREYMAAQQCSEGINHMLYQNAINSVRADMAAYETELTRRGYHWYYNRWLDADEYSNAMQDEAWEFMPRWAQRARIAEWRADMEED